MKWIIEYVNGKQLIEGKDIWDLSNQSLIKRIYLTDGRNEFGFLMNGFFFLNNKKIDLKLNLNDFELIPFKFKTGAMKFSPNFSNNSIISWNIGFKLQNVDEMQEYTLKVMHNYQIFIEAVKKDKFGETNHKNIRLQ
jgi:hypothetical protein